MGRHCKTYITAVQYFLPGRERNGIWYLREEKPVGEFDPEKNPNPAHEDVQGMLLEPGKIYGYEIFNRKPRCFFQGATTKSLSISKMNNKTYGIFEQYRLEDQ